MSDKNFGGMDLAAGDVTGLRVWTMDDWGRLHGVAHPAIWTPGENVAVCRAGAGIYYSFDQSKKCDDIANPDCGCGFWAYHYGGTDHTGDVTGVIQGYGKVTIGEKGFRCEKARIIGFSLDGLEPAKARRLSRNYPDVPQFPGVAAMLEMYPVSDEYAPNPETTEDFWTRSLTSNSLTVTVQGFTNAARSLMYTMNAPSTGFTAYPSTGFTAYPSTPDVPTELTLPDLPHGYAWKTRPTGYSTRSVNCQIVREGRRKPKVIDQTNWYPQNADACNRTLERLAAKVRAS